MTKKLSHIIALCLTWSSIALAGVACASELTLPGINDVAPSTAGEDQPRAVLLKAQVMLDRVGFSSGAIDGRVGENFANAVLAFQRQQGIPESGILDEPTWSTLLASSSAPVMVEYVIGAEDVRGPFAPEIPDNLQDMTALKRLAWPAPPS